MRNIRNNLLRIVLGGCLSLLPGFGHPQTNEPGGGSAVVFSYQRFGETDIPSTSVSIAQLEAHIRELDSGKYQVLPLEVIIDRLAAGKPLPDRAVAITIDDGFISAYREAWPRLRIAKLPFTLFITTDMIGDRPGRNLTWDQIREMLAGGGVGIGHHTAAHQHMPHRTEAANRADIAKATARFEAELGVRPTLFAYPYGEYSRRDRDMVAGLGFKAAFGHHSGVLYPEEDRFALPRFTMNLKYAALDRFKLAANALPLRARDITPRDPMLGPDNNPPSFGFTLIDPPPGLDRIGCYASHRDAPLEAQRLGENRIEVRMAQPFPRGPGRINCTLPDASGRWRWLGQAFYVP